MSEAKLTSAQLTKVFGVELPERYRRFIDSGEYQKYNHWILPKLKGHSSDHGFELVFDAEKLQTTFKVHGVKIAKEKKIPIAVPRRTELCVLTIDVAQPDGPVGIWEEGTFLSFLPSLDALLKQLQAPTAKPAPMSEEEEDEG
jgi:hypothetical protein